MDCKQCGKTVHGLNNYGNNENPLCYDCSVVIEKKRGINPEEMKAVNDFVNQLFSRCNGKLLKSSQGNLPYTVIAIVGLSCGLLMFYSSVKETSIYFSLIFSFLFLLPFYFPFCIFILLLGLYHIRSTINLETRQVTITRRNWAFYKRKVTETFPLESIQINAILFSDVPTTWMVRIGCGDYAILSKEFYSIRERNAAMLALLKKIFPEHSDIDESFIVEDGNTAFFKRQKE